MLLGAIHRRDALSSFWGLYTSAKPCSFIVFHNIARCCCCYCLFCCVLCCASFWDAVCIVIGISRRRRRRFGRENKVQQQQPAVAEASSQACTNTRGAATHRRHRPPPVKSFCSNHPKPKQTASKRGAPHERSRRCFCARAFPLSVSLLTTKVHTIVHLLYGSVICCYRSALESVGCVFVHGKRRK